MSDLDKLEQRLREYVPHDARGYDEDRGEIRELMIEAADRIRELEAGLVEALDRWENWDIGVGRSSHEARIATLRALASRKP